MEKDVVEFGELSFATSSTKNKNENRNKKPKI